METEIIEIKTEVPIEYVDYHDPNEMITYDNEPSLAPVEDIFADVGNNYELVSEIKVEPGTVGNYRDSITTVDVLLTCRYCQMKFTDGASYDRHMELHMDNDIYRCTKCNFKCTTDDFLIEHYKAFENDMNVPCIICEEEFSRMCFLLNHMEEHRKNKEIRLPPGTPDFFNMTVPMTVLACDNCDYKTVSAAALQTHLKPNEMGNLIKCSMCKEQFSLRCDFYNHMKDHMTYIGVSNKVGVIVDA